MYYQLRGSPEGKNTLSEDISVGGIAISEDKFIPPQAVLGLKINILSRVLSPVGRVSWLVRQPHSARYRIGIQFVELELKEKEYLSDYISLQRDLI